MHGLNHSLLLIVLILILALIVGYLFVALPIRLHIVYKGKGNAHSLVLRFQILNGSLGFTTKFAVGQKGEKKAEVGVAKRAALKFLRHMKRKSQGSQLNTLNEVKYYFTSLKKLLTYIQIFMQHCFCKRFVLSTTVGFNDYAATGFATGLLWAVQGCLIGYIFRQLRFLPPDGPIVRVIPKFGKAEFEIDLDCILETHLGHIMIQLMKFLWWWYHIFLNRSTRRWN